LNLDLPGKSGERFSVYAASTSNLPNVERPIPRSPATCSTVRPLVYTRRTASHLKSSVNFLTPKSVI